MASPLFSAAKIGGGNSSDSLGGYGFLVLVLVGVHFAAFLLWIGLLVANERKHARPAGKQD